jgi:hypothetical protein
MEYDNEQRQHYAYAPAPPRYERNGNGGGLSLTKATIPVFSVGLGAVMVITATWTLKENFDELKASMLAMQTSINTFITSTSDRISRIEQDIERIKGNRWSVQNHDLWCAREEAQNPNWTCVPSSHLDDRESALPPQFAAPSWGGVTTRRK